MKISKEFAEDYMVSHNGYVRGKFVINKIESFHVNDNDEDIVIYISVDFGSGDQSRILVVLTKEYEDWISNNRNNIIEKIIKND